jgi:hypothetical protein
MRESANFCENRLLFYLTTDNAPLSASVEFPPMFDARSVKTDHVYSVVAQTKVKTRD